MKSEHDHGKLKKNGLRKGRGESWASVVRVRDLWRGKGGNKAGRTSTVP